MQQATHCDAADALRRRADAADGDDAAGDDAADAAGDDADAPASSLVARTLRFFFFLCGHGTGSASPKRASSTPGATAGLATVLGTVGALADLDADRANLRAVDEGLVVVRAESEPEVVRRFVATGTNERFASARIIRAERTHCGG